MKFISVMDSWVAGVVNADIPGGIETTLGWVNNGDWKEMPDDEHVDGVLCAFDSAYASYLPMDWPVLKFWDLDSKESFFVKDVLFDNTSDAFICSDDKIRDKVQCIVSCKEESNG